MIQREFDDLLERYGGDLSSWPEANRAGAAALVEASSTARRALALLQEIESVLRSSQVAVPQPAELMAARAVRRRQLTPGRVRAARFGWAGAAAAALVFGILVGSVWPDREISPDRLIAASFATQGAVDVD